MIVECSKCGKAFDNQGKGFIRQFCSRTCANSHKQTACQNEARRNKLKTLPRIRVCKSCTNVLGKNNKSGYCKDCVRKTPEYKQALSKGTKGKCGGIRTGAGYGKSGWYKGYKCDSTWELAYVIYCLDNKISITRNTVGYEYEYNGKQHKYYPDFILDDGSFVEIKGYLDEKNAAKISQFPKKLVVLGKQELLPIFQYVKETYGVNYVTLFDNYEHKYTHICVVCGKEFKTDRKIGVCCSVRCGGIHTGHLRHGKRCSNNKQRKLSKETLERMELIVTSTIDFSKVGWVSLVSELTGMSYQNVTGFMKRNLKDFYEKNCFKNFRLS